MARKNPLGTIKDAAVGTILNPKGTAEKAVGQVVGGAKGGVELGMAVAGQVASKATDTVTSLVPGRKSAKPTGPTGPTEASPAPEPEQAVPAPESRKNQGDALAPVRKATKKAAPKKSAAEKAAPLVPDISPDKPVNVVKELGLDEAPVAEPATASPEKDSKPVTKIDAAADASAVDVTPADIAPAKKAASKKAPAKKAPAKKAPAKKAASKKTAAGTPGDKLPPPTS